MDYLKEYTDLVAQYKTLQRHAAQLHEHMDQIHRRIWELRQVASMAGVMIQNDPCLPLRYNTETMVDRILACLADAPSYPGLQRKHLAEEMEKRWNMKVNLNSLNGVLYQLKKAGRIESPAFGFYQVAGKIKPVT